MAALESVLIRLYLESPVGVGAPPPVIGGRMVQTGMAQGQTTQNGVQVGGEGSGNGMNGVNGSAEEGS